MNSYETQLSGNELYRQAMRESAGQDTIIFTADFNSHGQDFSSEDRIWEQALTNLFLGYEVIKMAQFEDKLHNFNQEILQNQGELVVVRDLYPKKLTKAEQLMRGKEKDVTSVNIASVQWKAKPSSGIHSGYSMGMCIIDCQKIGFFTLRTHPASADEYPSSWGIFKTVAGAQSNYAYLRGPHTDQRAMCFPVIQDNTITNGYHLEHLQIWLNNSMANKINMWHHEGSLGDRLPLGVEDQNLLLPRPLKPFPGARVQQQFRSAA